MTKELSLDIFDDEPEKKDTFITPFPIIINKSTTDYVVMDLESVPRVEDSALFDLKEVGQSKPINTPDWSDADIDDCLEQTIAEIEGLFKGKYNPSVQFLERVVEAEESREKPRIGLVKTMLKMMDECSKADEAIAANNKKMSVTPEYLRIVSLGWCVGNSGEVQSFTYTQSHDDHDAAEKRLLEMFWSIVGSNRGPLITFGGLHFDIPAIMTRSIMLGVEPTRKFDTSPWKSDVIDLFKKRFPSMGGKTMSLKHIAPLYGIEVPAGDFDGSQVFDAWQEDELDLIDEYCKSDIVITRELAVKLQDYYF